MAINGIGQFGGLYNNYKMPEITKVSVEDVKKQQEASAKSKQELNTIETLQKDTPKAEDHRSRIADLENISLSFNTNETYDYIGKDASLENLDMMSAISDMQKDKVLEQYQYFVAPQDVNSIISSSDDGIVIQK